MNRQEIFKHIYEGFDQKNIDYVILHSYQQLPKQFNSDIDTAIRVDNVIDAVELLSSTLRGTGWYVVQYWRHENYAADCVITNDQEFLQVDFCTHYERNGRVILNIDELLQNRRKYNNFYVPCPVMEFTYIFVKKILKKEFSEASKIQLQQLLKEIQSEEGDIKCILKRYFSEEDISSILQQIENDEYEMIKLDTLRIQLLKSTFSVGTCLHYQWFDFKRKISRIIHPTGLFIVLLGVDGSGKTTIANELEKRYATAFRKIKHYHSRVRVLKDISQINPSGEKGDVTNPHEKKNHTNIIISIIKFFYYYLDFLIGNLLITISKIKSSLVVVERYYYDYLIDKVRYNLKLPDGFLRFWGHLVKKPDIIFVLTGEPEKLYARKHEITIEEIQQQIDMLNRVLGDNHKAIFIDTTATSVDACVNQLLSKCNAVMKGN